MPPSSAWIPQAVRASIAGRIVPQTTTHAMVLSANATREAVASLKASFPPTALHAFAVKANGLYRYLQLLNEAGMGFETASIGEFSMARRVADPTRIVFDSPCKTEEELRVALALPCYLNVDNFQELERVARIYQESQAAAKTAGDDASAPSFRAHVGIRVNPQVGFGSIGATSTGNATSKFGVGLDDQAEAIVAAYKKHSFLDMIHVHTGSQGVGIPLMAKSIRKVFDFLSDRLPANQVKILDIGGGLPVNFASDEWAPSFEDYGAALRETVPALFEENPKVRIITEFGRAICAKAGVFISRVEYTKVNGGRHIVQQHVGADVLIRQAWAPEEWKVRVAVFDGATGEERTADVVQTDVAGPCCFGSDLACKDRPLPTAYPGDVVVIKDLGGYAHSSFSRYNLRQAPAVYLLHEAGSDGAQGGARLELIRRAETIEETLEFMMPGI